MKLPIYIFLLQISLLVSCQKKEYLDGKVTKEIKTKIFNGEYDWFSSSSQEENGFGEDPLYSLTPSELGYNYGMRIKKSGKCYLFKDGSLVTEGEIDKVEQVSYYSSNCYMGSGGYVVYIDWETGADMKFTTKTSSQLYSSNFPVDSLSNLFIKRTF